MLCAGLHLTDELVLVLAEGVGVGGFSELVWSLNDHDVSAHSPL